MKWVVYIALSSLMLSCVNKSSKVDTSLKNDLIKINGVGTYITSSGNGEPIIIIHGGPGLGHDYLYSHLQKLAEDYQLIFYDQRAAGRTEYVLDSSAIRMDSLVDDIDAIRAYFGYDQINLLAHSFGGLLALQYAIQHPDKLNKLILVNSLAPLSEINTQANTRLANRFSVEDISARTEIIRSEAFKNGDPLVFEQLMKNGFKYQFKDPDKVDLLILNLPKDFRERSQVMQGLGPDLVNYDWSSSVKEIKNDVLLIYGTLDPLYQLALPVFEKLLPHMRTVTIEDSGHFPFIERPEAVFAAIRDFLTPHALTK